MICAVFGLLSLIGRMAEVAPREDDDSRPLPTADLMGYNALGIVFGPLLVGDLLDQYTMKVATPNTGLLVFPLSPPRFRRERRKPTQLDAKSSGPPTVDKILVANSITEMLIANWRDVVRQMKSLGTHCRKDTSLVDLVSKDEKPPSPQGSTLRAHQNCDGGDNGIRRDEGNERREVFEPPVPGQRKRRLKVLRRSTSQRLNPKMSFATLSPTKEESMGDDESTDENENRQIKESVIQRLQKAKENRKYNKAAKVPNTDTLCHDAVEGGPRSGPRLSTAEDNIAPEVVSGTEHAQVYLESVPPRESSRNAASHDGTDISLRQTTSQRSVNSARLLDDIASDSSRSTQTPRTRRLSLTSSVRSETPKPPPGRTSPVSPSLICPTVMPEGGIRLVQQTPAQNPKAELMRNGRASPGIGASYVSQDQGVQCDMLPESKARHSIDVTPERFYTYGKVLGNEARMSLDSIQQLATRQKPRAVIPQPRLSKSHENLRGQTTVMRQSPIESTESKGLSKRGSVKTMAAMFETQTTGRQSPSVTEDAAEARNDSKRQTRKRHSKSDSAWTHHVFDPMIESGQENPGGSTARGHPTELHQVFRGILNDGLKGAGLEREVEGGFQDATSYSPSKLLGRAGTGTVDEKALKAVPSLGTMVPCREQPPVAHHLNLARPASSPSPMQEPELYTVMDIVSTTQTPRPRSATVLYTQIRNLQRQLNSKTEEAAQLRRQLEAQKDSDVGTVSEQLRQAKRAVATWKERAETAERRVKVFEKFVEKLKEIRDAIADSNPYEAGNEEDKGSEQQQSHNGSLGIRRAINALHVADGTDDKGNDGKENEAPTAAAKSQKCRQGLSAAQDGTLDSDLASSATGEAHGRQSGCTCLARRMRKSSEQILAVAEELLRMHEDDAASMVE
ncbi:GTPase activating protein Rga6 [Metarhizium album ARSEF 1941]|uniref:GTPase activating protein Rga6 n=1 Tax=Metarhizium album (strain ARSEF 1941) TaxID=1081103 RepID=A0A0B2WDS6_METAS|nr:GTPase activating protein Rga6 [Metarhizium album ARSEF 1941]KHN94031.1 GTPase activating protein Rga6 [Metarhizium album ARSEF 1941]